MRAFLNRALGLGVSPDGTRSASVAHWEMKSGVPLLRVAGQGSAWNCLQNRKHRET